jgi:hypothetical protein
MKHRLSIKDTIFPSLKDFVITEKGRKDVLSGKVKFPLQVQPAAHLQDMKSDIAHAEKLFRIALKEKMIDYAHELLDAGIVSYDTDFIFNCCSNPSDESMNLVMEFLNNKPSDIPVGYWNRSIDACLHTLFLSTEFTPSMKQVIGLLCDNGADINKLYINSNVFLTLLNYYPSRISVEKVKVMIECGIDFSIKSNNAALSATNRTIVEHITHGINLDTMIEILTLIRNNQ